MLLFSAFPTHVEHPTPTTREFIIICLIRLIRVLIILKLNLTHPRIRKITFSYFLSSPSSAVLSMNEINKNIEYESETMFIIIIIIDERCLPTRLTLLRCILIFHQFNCSTQSPYLPLLRSRFDGMRKRRERESEWGEQIGQHTLSAKGWLAVGCFS